MDRIGAIMDMGKARPIQALNDRSGWPIGHGMLPEARLPRTSGHQHVHVAVAKHAALAAPARRRARRSPASTMTRSVILDVRLA
jgi:hypothetical protein